MAKVKLYNREGKEVKEIEVADAVFGLLAIDELEHQVFFSLSANQRQVLAHTKNRGERAGSGIKPWKQKGTGRARVGSRRYRKIQMVHWRYYVTDEFLSA